MIFFNRALYVIFLVFTFTTYAQAKDWTSIADQSRIAFGSIKKNVIGEVHHFNQVKGTVSDNGDLSITIDLASLETNIDIRNERMTKHVFLEGQAGALIAGQIDMEEVRGLKVGEMATIEVEVTLSFVGVENDIDAELLVVRLAENRVLVATTDFIMISTEDLEIDPGIDKLMELASLPGITRATPVAIRMVFEK